ncbi:MAG: metal ABC transporter ATP-binding protein [Anaerolineales bacterium]
MRKTQSPSARVPALVVEDFSAGYPGARHVLRHVGFSVMPGDYIGILGPNGAGKSTLFKAIAGLIPHETGCISIHGENCRRSHNLVGYVPQIENIDWNFPATVRDVVMMGRTRQIGWFLPATPAHWRKVDSLLDRVGMADFRQRQIGALSGGQRRRVFIARALAQETDVLLLDEPFSGVDISAEREIQEALDQLNAEGITIIVATHDMEMAQTQFDRLLLLKHRVIAYGTPKEVFTPGALREAYGRRVGVIEHGNQTVIVADFHA